MAEPLRSPQSTKTQRQRSCTTQTTNHLLTKRKITVLNKKFRIEHKGGLSREKLGDQVIRNEDEDVTGDT